MRRIKANGSSFSNVVGTPSPTTHLTLFLLYTMSKFYNVNWMIEEDNMETEYKLLIKGVGNYAADSLTELFWIVFKHRCEHFFKGEGFRD